MEATKERMEKEQKKKKRDESAAVSNEAGKAADTVRTIIRESIVEGGSGDRDGGDNARKPEDILAFSRTKKKTMSIIPINDRRRISPGDRVWEPFEHMNTFFDFPSPSLLLSRHFPPLPREIFPSSSSSTQLNWTETPTAHVLKAYLPGTTQDEAIVFVDDEGYLQICSGDNKFMSRFKLPDNALTDQVTAWMEEGFLVVFVAKDGSSSPPPPGIEENRNVRVVEITGDDY